MNEERRDEVRLLIVEDDVDLGEMLAMVLRRRGLTVSTVTDGAAALEAIDRIRPHVALVDLGLPDVDGCALARQIGLGGPALVAHTGDGSDAQRRRTREAGFVAHVVKPARPSELAALLADLARERIAVTGHPAEARHPILSVRGGRAHFAA